jgi:hypothetical protein
MGELEVWQSIGKARACSPFVDAAIVEARYPGTTGIAASAGPQSQTASDTATFSLHDVRNSL